MGSSAHRRLIACGVIHLLVYGVGFMAVCAYGLIRLRLRAQAEHAKGQRAMLWFRFLYFGEHLTECWGVVVGIKGCAGFRPQNSSISTSEFPPGIPPLWARAGLSL